MFCAHCKSGPASQSVDDNRGFRREQPRITTIAFPTLGQTMKQAVGEPISFNGLNRYSRTSTHPMTAWGQAQRTKTVTIISGMRAGGLRPLDDDPITRILLGR
jgi:transcription initiation factor TFIID subunit TAF12